MSVVLIVFCEFLLINNFSGFLIFYLTIDITIVLCKNSNILHSSVYMYVTKIVYFNYNLSKAVYFCVKIHIVTLFLSNNIRSFKKSFETSVLTAILLLYFILVFLHNLCLS